MVPWDASYQIECGDLLPFGRSLERWRIGIFGYVFCNKQCRRYVLIGGPLGPGGTILGLL